MRPSTAHRALCALLAVALVALPSLATAARVVPGANQAHQRALKNSGTPDVIGHIPCYSTPSGVVASAEVQVAIGALIGYIPICRDASGIYLGAFISIVAGIGLPVADGTYTLPPALGAAVSVGVGIAVGKFIPCYYGAPATSLLPAVLGVGIDIDLDLVIGALTSITPLLIDAQVGLGVGAAIGGVLAVGKPAVGLDLLGLVDVEVQLGAILGCLPFITTLAPATSSPCPPPQHVCVGELPPWGSSTPIPSHPPPIVPNTLVVADIEAKVLIGWFPIYLHPETATTPVLGLLDLAIGVFAGVGINVGGTKCSVSGAPIAYLPCYGPAAIAHS